MADPETSSSADLPSSSSSPRTCPLQLAEYFPCLLESFLQSSLNDSLSHCSLPKEFCASLLKSENWDGYDAWIGSIDSDADDPLQWQKDLALQQASATVGEGVPVYPLHKHVASALCAWIATASFPRNLEPVPGFSEDETWTAKIEQWNSRVVELGAALKELVQCVKFQLQVQEPFFSQLRDGSKTVEGRCAVGAYNRLSPGDLILINNVLLQEVKAVNRYKSFEEMLGAEGVDAVLPGINSIAEGVMVYRRFYSEEKEKIGGVLAIHVHGLPEERQPLKITSDIIQELEVDGVRALLGFRSTVGTVADSLPPSRSALLSSFLAANNENVPGSKLTAGARALAKHVHRSSSRWWGPFSGKEKEKNQHALNIIIQIIQQACWMNMHHVHPNLTVFEIRVSEGYGARWSADGTQFRGFLEPHMEDGHAKKWSH